MRQVSWGKGNHPVNQCPGSTVDLDPGERLDRVGRGEHQRRHVGIALRAGEEDGQKTGRGQKRTHAVGHAGKMSRWTPTSHRRRGGAHIFWRHICDLGRQLQNARPPLKWLGAADRSGSTGGVRTVNSSLGVQGPGHRDEGLEAHCDLDHLDRLHARLARSRHPSQRKSNRPCQRCGQASNAFTTFPWMSVRRKSRPA